MLDLNLDIVSSESSSCDDENNKMLIISTGNKKPDEAEGSSGSTNSSIINDAEDINPSNNAGRDEENSSNNASANFAFNIFDILLKKETEDDTTNAHKKVENPLSEFVTRQLFPATGAGKGGGLELEFGTSSFGGKPNLGRRPRWLKLCNYYADSSGDAEAELKTVHQIKAPQPRKTRRGPKSRSSQYRGVTFYRRTGRWESHIWDCGKQVYLGGFDSDDAAARAYDRAAIKFRGVDADINFNLSDYEEDMNQMNDMSKEEFVHILRRQSNGSSRGSSKYRGVTLMHKCGRWEARMGQLLENKAYDMAAMKCNGKEAVTNFEPSSYEGAITISEGASAGNFHNLDLSLGISSPSVAQNESKNAGEFPFRHVPASTRERPVFESSASTSGGVQSQHCLTIASNHPPMLSSVYPAVLPKYEERGGMEKRVEAVSSSTRLTNWGWQMQGNGNNMAPTHFMFPIAASSGFSSSIATAASSTTFPFNSSAQNICFLTPPTSTNNNFHY